ncbi:uncharacterized protein (TIGR04141 family) [Actinoallomurus bryophytorum]|uniref:Uncharacterized protein (TIGR04141 family) n=2 Tax=Actinoallomurus bryophytorum TaxID=1490222 RepID=A0A543CWG5_9ACTN|nr:uncharacterized protein (TIGR04141 family) [Actinoallomurus bryophytorum]
MSRKVSLYRLDSRQDDELRSHIQSKYLDAEEFRAWDVLVAGVDGLLVAGVIASSSPKWLSHVQSLVDLSPDLSNNTSAAVLLVPYERYVYTLSWGFGHLIVEPGDIDPGFGLRFALRRANPEQVRALTVHTMDTLARTARTTVPGGATLDAFGMEEIGEIVSRLVGRVSSAGLTAARGSGNDAVTIRGADGLSIPLGREAEGLLADLRFLHTVVEHESPIAGLEHFEQTKPLRSGDPAVETLKERLAEALIPGAQRIALSWPAEWEEDYGEADGYFLAGLGRGWDDRPDTLELEHLLGALAERSSETRLAALKRIKIQALDANGGAVSRAISGDKWITFEDDLHGQRYVFHQGRWFNIGSAYLDMLRGKISRIFAQRSMLELPAWPKTQKKNGVGPVIERRYNEYASAQNDSLLCLDRKLIRTEQHDRGIEACDLLGPDNELIHVKRLGDSVSASHLFNQATVSAEALRRQADAQESFRARVREVSNGARDLPEDFRPRKVVLAFAEREATPRALMTFSQVTLARCAQRIGELDMDLEIVEIGDSEDLIE